MRAERLTNTTSLVKKPAILTRQQESRVEEVLLRSSPPLVTKRKREYTPEEKSNLRKAHEEYLLALPESASIPRRVLKTLIKECS